MVLRQRVLLHLLVEEFDCKTQQEAQGAQIINTCTRLACARSTVLSYQLPGAQGTTAYR
jgi:hypothetical protein